MHERKKARALHRLFRCTLTQTALVTLPERRQREQTLTVLGVPFTIALTRLMLGFQVLLVFLLEWDTASPN